METVKAYVRGFREAVNAAGYLGGVYGSAAVMKTCMAAKVADRYWQTYAWSKGEVVKGINLYQRKNDFSMHGVNIDDNDTFGDEGWWPLDVKEEKPFVKGNTKFSDVPAGHWAESSIKQVSEAGLMNGLPDGSFGLGKPVSREELAAVVANLLNKTNLSKKED
jgi:hypothetical protein